MRHCTYRPAGCTVLDAPKIALPLCRLTSKFADPARPVSFPVTIKSSPLLTDHPMQPSVSAGRVVWTKGVLPELFGLSEYLWCHKCLPRPFLLEYRRVTTRRKRNWSWPKRYSYRWYRVRKFLYQCSYQFFAVSGKPKRSTC